MLVRERMISAGKQVTSSLPMEAAIEIFEQSGYTWLPVVDQEGRLIGLITLTEIQKAKEALSKAEDKSDQNGYTAQDFMAPRFLYVTEKTPIEEAARIMIDYDVPELPVVKDNYYTGIITQQIMLRILMEITGARRQGIRLMVEMENKNGELLSLLELIRDQKGTVQGICTYCTQENEYLIVTMRVDGVDKYNLKQEIRNLGFKVIDIR